MASTVADNINIYMSCCCLNGTSPGTLPLFTRVPPQSFPMQWTYPTPPEDAPRPAHHSRPEGPPADPHMPHHSRYEGPSANALRPAYNSRHGTANVPHSGHCPRHERPSANASHPMHEGPPASAPHPTYNSRPGAADVPHSGHHSRRPSVHFAPLPSHWYSRPEGSSANVPIPTHRSGGPESATSFAPHPIYYSRSGGRAPGFVNQDLGMAINYCLEWVYGARAPLEQGLVWDVVLPPIHTAKMMTVRGTIIKPDFGAGAFQESRTNRFEIWSDQPTLAYYMRKWGPVVTPKANPTIKDALNDIYEYLRTPLSPNDLHRVCSRPGNTVLLEKARRERAKDVFDLYDVTIRGPFLRSDILGGHRRFQGIRPEQLADGSFRLLFNLGPGPVPRFV